MRKITVITVLCLLSQIIGYGQEKKVMTATRIQDPIVIDGLLNESCWSLAQNASDFVELEPYPGRDPQHQTCVKIIYDDSGIYIGAEIDEQHMESLGKELAERDNLDDSKKIDWFGVVFDCYGTGLSGYGFIVTASGVQTDIKFIGNDNDDSAWDAVWDSDVAQHDGYWTCEIKVPYSALRFPETEVQSWGVQFGRRSYQRQEESFWNPIDPTQDGFLSQAGKLEGLEGIKPPVRLSATPFLAAYVENVYDPNYAIPSSWGSSYNGGMDVRYGISDAYTLDMTLIPDFGQVQSDNEVLNLSPFEIQFAENRQFFTEGTELFNRAGIFYSRRVGDTPYYYGQVYNALQANEAVYEIKQESRLVNATKISGRGKNGTGLGYFNAISPRQHAVVQDTLTDVKRDVILQPWTNYNVVVLDQHLKNNSYFSIINTNVLRENAARDANVTGIEFDLRDKPNKYGISGSAAYSQQWVPGDHQDGYKYTIELARHSGNVIWEVGQDVESDTYDPNDLGFLESNNQRDYRGFIEYNQPKPSGPFLNYGFGTYGSYNNLYRFPGKPEEQVRPNLFTRAGVEVWFYCLFKNFYRFNTWSFMSPTTRYDYFEPRVAGRFYKVPAFKEIGVSMDSDSRKRWRGGVNYRYTGFHEEKKYQHFGGFYTTFRFNDHISLWYEWQKNFAVKTRGYITEIGEDIVFGERDYSDLSQILQATYTFNPKMSLSFRLRHNWTQVRYQKFYTLLLDGNFEDRVYEENEDINYNAWTIDTNFRWRYAPGSDLFIVWKNSIFGEDDQSMISYGENLGELFDNPQSNSFSIKAIYYIDFQQW